MIENLQIHGKWWIQNYENESISGILTFNQFTEGILTLDGMFDDRFISEDGTALFSEIFGYSNEGEKLTLSGCRFVSQELFSTNSRISKFNIDNIFIGEHILIDKNCLFNKLSINFSFLEEWIEYNSIYLKKILNEEFILKYKSYNISISPNDIINNFAINIVKDKPEYSIKFNEFSMKQKAYIKISSNAERSFKQFIEIIQKLQNFLSFSTSRPIFPISIIGDVKKETENFKEIKIYYKLDYYRDIPKNSLSLNTFLFSYNDIKDRVDFYLTNWFNKINSLLPSFDLYLSIIFNPKMHLNQQFLNIIIALESFHSHVFNSKYFNEELKKSIIKKIDAECLANIPSDIKKKIIQKLQYINEFSLRSRLKDLFGKFNYCEFTFFRNEKEFIEKIVAIRNFLIHYDKKLKSKIPNDEEFFYIIQKLKVLLEVCLLGEIGFSKEETNRFILRNHWRSYIVKKV